MEDFKFEGEQVSPIDALFDEENDENIILFDAEGNECEFEQVAVIPYDSRVFAILRPVGMEGIADDEAFVFELSEDDDGEVAIDLVEDDATIDAVFEEYYKLLDEAE